MTVLFNSQSKLPLILTTVYIIVSILAFVLMFATMATNSLSGIFVVLVALPWSSFFVSLIDSIGIDSIVLNTVLMAVGVAINALIIYVFFCYSKK